MSEYLYQDSNTHHDWLVHIFPRLNQQHLFALISWIINVHLSLDFLGLFDWPKRSQGGLQLTFQCYCTFIGFVFTTHTKLQSVVIWLLLTKQVYLWDCRWINVKNVLQQRIKTRWIFWPEYFNYFNWLLYVLN